MKAHDILKVIIQVAEELGYKHSEDYSLSRTRIIIDKDDSQFILTPVEDLNTVTIAYSVINIGLDIEEYDRAELINQMNLRLDCNSGSLVLLPDKTFEDQLEMILTKDLLAISVSHLKKSLPKVISSMSETKTFYTNALIQAMSKGE